MKDRIRILTNLFTGIMPWAAWVKMAGGPSGVLLSGGLGSLKYFTVLSNLLEGAASFLWLGTMLVRRKRIHWVEVVKFIACMSVFLTFTTVMVFLGPRFGFASMFRGVNFWMHLVVPLAAMLELLFCVREKFSLKETVYAVIPVLLYGCTYLGNILKNGVGEQGHWNDFYGFVTWGLPAGMGIFGGICAIVFLAAQGFRKVTGRGR